MSASATPGGAAAPPAAHACTARRAALALDPVRVFLLLALPSGVALCAAVPPLAAPDEEQHVSRAWAIAEGSWRVPGRAQPDVAFPRSVVALARDVNGRGRWPRIERRPPRHVAVWLAQPLDPERRVRLRAAGLYAPVVYAPALPGVWLGRALELAPAAIVYLARAGTLAAWIALVALALAIAPVRRWTLLVLATPPMAVALAASVSADPLTNATALLLVAVALRVACGGPRPLARSEVSALLAAALATSVGKPAYWPLAALGLLVPPARCGGRARWLALAAAIAAAAILPSALWLLVAQQSEPGPAAPGADPGAQARAVLGDPVAFLTAAATTVREQLAAWAATYVGVLGRLLVPLPSWAYWLYGAVVLGVTVADGPPARALGRAQRAILLGILAACLATTLGTAYLGWNPVGAPRVAGVQGRYFLPLAPLAALAWRPRARALPPALAGVATGGLAVVLGAAVVSALRAYWL